MTLLDAKVNSECLTLEYLILKKLWRTSFLLYLVPTSRYTRWLPTALRSQIKLFIRYVCNFIEPRRVIRWKEETVEEELSHPYTKRNFHRSQRLRTLNLCGWREKSAKIDCEKTSLLKTEFLEHHSYSVPILFPLLWNSSFI